MMDSECLHPRRLPKVEPGEEIVISGVAGRFPECNNLYELHDALVNKKDLITDDDRRWKMENPGIPQRTGKLYNIEKFDALFFGVHPKQAHSMDPMCRMLLEHSYEAIIDAGVNPKHLRGSRTGVFVGACYTESEKPWFYDKPEPNGFGLMGCSRAMLTNRISYYFGLTGPSVTIDTACSSSLCAMEQAYRAIQDDLCDAALVGGCNLCLHPYISMQFFNLGVLSADGVCKTFDEAADGYARSEAVAMMFLQKSKDAKRIYATFIHGKVNCDGYKEEGVTFPSSRMQSLLLKEFYIECGVSPLEIAYVEAHGTGTKVGDPEEVNAMDKVFGIGRTENNPLLIGSVKTNLGHSEPASGVCSVSKVLMAMETGVIPPNINFKKCKSELTPVLEGRMKVLTEPQLWNGGYVGVSSFGFGGLNVHVLLKSNPKEKINQGVPTDNLPRLVCTSGRTDEAVSTILNDMERKPVDVEYVKLLHDIHSDEINGHLYKGYSILSASGVSDTPIREIKSVSGIKRPVWFVFSGMGSQWPEMGKALLHIPIFAEAIKKCDAILKPRDIDIYNILTNGDKSTFNNILNSFLGIAAVQIGLVDILRALKIEPDNIIGHSVGELGCAYADGCFTAEQMILAAYSRGLASIETKVIHGSMAAIGMGYKELRKLCPEDIEVACHNSSENATVSGPAESMKKFVARLQANGIFAKEVPCSNIPYHSKYIAAMGPRLLAYLKKVIPDPKPRSAKWVSSSVPKDKWNTPQAQLSSAEYHTNNLLNSVLFEETANLIPKNAITIEIAPHGLLQAILRRSLHPSVINIPLTQRGHKNNVEVLLQALGKMYMEGLYPQLANLYPHVKYPVSRSTPMISPLIKWQHSDDWFVYSIKDDLTKSSSERIIKISVTDNDFETIAGHIIDGRNLFPATGYLFLTWETFSMIHGKMYFEFPIVFEDVKFMRATNVPKEGKIEFTVVIHKGTGRFEIMEGGAAVVTGLIRQSLNLNAEKVSFKHKNEEELMTARDVYKELRLRGYQYSGMFRSITSSSITGSNGHITWHNDWIAFMDNMLQIKILSYDSRGLFVPTSLKKMIIDVAAQNALLRHGEKELEVRYSKLHDVIMSGGIEIQGLQASAIAKRKPTGEPVLEEFKFVPFMDGAEVSHREMARLSTHIGMENHAGIKVKTIEFHDRVFSKNLLSPWISEALGDVPLIQADVVVFSMINEFDDEIISANVSIVDPKKALKEPTALLVIGHRLLTKEGSNELNILLAELKPGGFILSREQSGDSNYFEEAAQSIGCHAIMFKKSGDESFVLLKKQTKPKERTLIIKVNNENFDWVNKMRETMTKELEKDAAENLRIIFVGQGHSDNGVLGLVNCLRQEPGGEIVRGVLIQDPNVPEFSLENPFYAKQMNKDLFVCVLRNNGIWGSYRHLPLPSIEHKLVRHAWIGQQVRADLSSLTWLEGPIPIDNEDKNIVNIVYTSINFKDVMLATGKLTVESVFLNRRELEYPLGFEYSGITNDGKRVMGMVCRGLANLCIADPAMMWDISDKWTLEEAATIPVVYGTCYYAFYVKGRMKKSHSVLIHAGAGGVGQAAINLALYAGCEVFTTVGTPEKREFIRNQFPQIPDDHIGNSRDTSFLQMIMDKTDGRGVDIVLNSLAEDKLQASVNCLAWGGQFLEIGKFDLTANNSLGMQCFLREISFQGVMLDHLFNETLENKQELAVLMEEGLQNGAVKPLVRTVFPKDQLESAFRYMATGKHIGKVIIRARDEKEPINALTLAQPRYYCVENGSYIILGGLGGFGLELVDWMVLRGARNIVITSRTGVKNGYQTMRIKLWKSYGAKIVIISGKDASVLEDCQYIIDTAAKLAPVDGIFNLAVVLRDALWDNQTPESFEESFRAKAWATNNLDVLTRKLCPELRHFVVFSSVSCGRGNAGQTNYGMSNSVMERICERRAAEGLPGLAIEWGAIGDVGLVADMQEDDKELIIGGTLQQKINSCLHELDGFLQQSRPIVSSIVVAEKRAGSAGALNIVDTVLNIMGLKDLTGVSPNTSLAELGMDSMMAVEIKQTLEREFEIFLNSQDIRNLNFNKLQEMDENIKSKEEKAQKLGTNDDVLGRLKLLVRGFDNIEVGNEVCLRLPTKEDRNKGEILLIPGIEGLASSFDNLTPKIKAPATCLQLGIKNHSFDSISDMADYLLPYTFERLKGQTVFTLVAHSFGALIAIELARKLEARNLQGRLIIIDGAPEPLKTIIEHETYGNNDDLENKALAIMLNIVSPADIPQLMTTLETCKTWEDKLDIINKICPASKLNMSAQDQADICTTIYKRIVATTSYDVSNHQPIETPIILLKPKEQPLVFEMVDYGLSKLTRKPVEIHNLSGDHVTILDNDEVANVINENIYKG